MAFFIKNSTGGTCKICFTDVKSGGSGGNTTNLKNHLIRNHATNPDVKKTFLKGATADTQKTNTSDPALAVDDQDLTSGPSTSRPSLTSTMPSPASLCVDLDSNSNSMSSWLDASPAASTIESELSERSSTTSTTSTCHFQPRIDNAFKHIKSFEVGGTKSGEITNAIMFMMVKDNMPFNTVEREGFKYLMKTTVPLHSVPGRKSITKYMEEKYNYLSSITKDKLKIVQHFSLTSDLWTDVLNNVSYLGVTAHYEFEDELRSTTIGVTEIKERHTAEVLGTWMESVMDDWFIEKDKVVVMVTDNGANIVKAVHDKLGPNKHLPCFAHTINLVATSTMDFVVTKIKTIVTFFKRSSVAASELRKLSVLKLIQCVDTHWNSTYYMLERFILLADIVGSILLKIPDSPLMLTASELQLAKEIFEVLRPIEQVTKELCGEKYVTSSKIIPMMYCLRKKVESFRIRLQTPTARALLDRLQFQITERFGNITANRIIAVSTILDPRFKRLHFEQNEHLACAQSVNYIAKLMKESDQMNMSTLDATMTEENVDNPHMSDNLWAYHEDLFKGQFANLQENNQDKMPTDLKHYLNQPLTKLKENPMYYWNKKYKMMYPTLSEIAKKYLPVVATSVPSERLFSRAGNILNEDRHRLSPDHLEHLLFLNSLTAKEWLLD